MTAKKDTAPVDQQKNETPECFVVMPISDQPGYHQGHFTAVYRDLIKPAIIAAGYRPIRADEVKSANIIHMDIINRLIGAPLVVCDLSGLNPNVMYELGIRQSFGLPVVLIKDERTRDIFDIAPIRYQLYQSGRLYDTTIAFHRNLTSAIIDTTESVKEARSFIELLSIKQAATLPKVSTDNIEAIKTDVIMQQLSEITKELKTFRRLSENSTLSASKKYEFGKIYLKNNNEQAIRQIKNRLNIILASEMDAMTAHHEYSSLLSELQTLEKYSDSQAESDELASLMSRCNARMCDLSNELIERNSK